MIKMVSKVCLSFVWSIRRLFSRVDRGLVFSSLTSHVIVKAVAIRTDPYE